MPKIYLYTDRYGVHSILAQGLRASFGAGCGFEFKILNSQLLEQTIRLETALPDILLLDLSAEALSDTLRETQEAAAHVKLVLLVETISNEMACQAIRLGVRGILPKDLPTGAILNGIRKIHAGEFWFEGVSTERHAA